MKELLVLFLLLYVGRKFLMSLLSGFRSRSKARDEDEEWWE